VFTRRFTRIDLTNSSEDYPLKVGEEAYISFQNTTNVPLNIATENNSYYELHIIPSITGGTTGNNYFSFLYANNTAYSNAFQMVSIFQNLSEFGNQCLSCSGFIIGKAFSVTKAWLTNRTQYKNARAIFSIYGYSEAWPEYMEASTDWRDTTTLWISLGTIVFPQSSTGEIIIRRLF
jgi:hypothetical protein